MNKKKLNKKSYSGGIDLGRAVAVANVKESVKNFA